MNVLSRIRPVIRIFAVVTLSSCYGPPQASATDAEFTVSSNQGVLACLGIQGEHFAITYKAASPTNESRECVLVRRDLIGKMHMTDVNGRAISLCAPEVNKQSSYPDSFEVNLGKVRWPHMTTFILHTNELSGVLRHSFFDYFKLGKPGHYVFTLEPTVYLRLPKRGDPQLKYKRVDFPPLQRKIVITQDMIKAAKARPKL